MEITNENMFYLRDAVFKFIQEKEPELDRVTVLWCVENLCISGKTMDEALTLLRIPHDKPNDLK